MRLPRHLHIAIAAVLAVALVGAAFAVGAVIMLSSKKPAPAAVAAAVVLFPSAPSISPDSLLARAAIIYDPTDGRVLFAKDADESLPLASLTKLMTAEVVLGNVSPDTMVTITKEDLAPGGDWDGGLKLGDKVSVGSLLKIGLIASSNDAITAAASAVGEGYVAKMNTEAASMGLSKTRFFNPTGLDIDANTAGAYGSVFDVARLAANFYAHYPQYFELTRNQSVSVERDGEQQLGTATAAPLLTTPGFIAAKTGYTDLAGGNLVALFDVEVGHPLVAVVLGSTRDGRFDDMLALIKAARAADSKTL